MQVYNNIFFLFPKNTFYMINMSSMSWNYPCNGMWLVYVLVNAKKLLRFGGCHWIHAQHNIEIDCKTSDATNYYRYTLSCDSCVSLDSAAAKHLAPFSPISFDLLSLRRNNQSTLEIVDRFHNIASFVGTGLYLNKMP